MKRLVLFVIASACVAAVAALARPSAASAGWCWPSCGGYGILNQSTSTYTGCWFSSGEVCSYYNSWFNVGLTKTCYPGCDWNYRTTGVVLYGFENHDRIRGVFTDRAETVYTRPSYLSMTGLTRAQMTWYAGTNQVNGAAIG